MRGLSRAHRAEFGRTLDRRHERALRRGSPVRAPLHYQDDEGAMGFAQALQQTVIESPDEVAEFIRNEMPALILILSHRSSILPWTSRAST